jgi:hypothetical protein
MNLLQQLSESHMSGTKLVGWHTYQDAEADTFTWYAGTPQEIRDKIVAKILRDSYDREQVTEWLGLEEDDKQGLAKELEKKKTLKAILDLIHVHGRAVETKISAK